MEEHSQSNNDMNINNIFDQMNKLKTHIRLTKSDKDIVEKYTHIIQTELNSLQQKYHELNDEKDSYIEKLDEIQNQCYHQIDRLLDDKKHLQDKNADMENELNETKRELSGIQYDYDIIQIDYHKEKDANHELQIQIRELRKKYRLLQHDIIEADKATTKRLNRLIELLETTEKEKKHFMEIVQTYEYDLEATSMLCFVCRAGVKMNSCVNCHKKICKKCYETVEKCPFCRHNVK
jgi:DNA repair exonuclease SbcCD ATPase subunit